MYILFVNSCDFCGGEVKAKNFDKFPTKKQRRDLKDSLGEMSCIKEYLFELRDAGEMTEIK